MPKAKIIFGSTTGNTETASEAVSTALSGKGWDVEIKSVDDCSAKDMESGADVIFLGCSTWGDEDIELQEDFEVFYEDMTEVDLSGCKVAVFGCGDSSYTHFCGAVDVIETRAGEQGAELVTQGLKIDGDPEDVEDEIIEWAQGAAGI